MTSLTNFDKNISVSVIGSGNLAWHLIPALEKIGYEINEVYSKSEGYARALTDLLYQAKIQTNLDFSQSKSTLFIVAVSDSAVAEIANQIILPPNSIIVHTSGNTDISVFSKLGNYGVFYPIQSFSKQRSLSFKNIPIALEASSDEVMQVLKNIADKLTQNYTLLNSVDRSHVHLAAVFACNFTNHMMSIAYDILDVQDINLNILAPLVRETVAKAMEANHPRNGQTGPAVRGDSNTIENHLKLLDKHPSFKKTYQLLTDAIQSQS
jgi:predicted short-subunit dehydrogenase-like oxidoreductase (DUF2520 family)